jgi:hypothetical protein
MELKRASRRREERGREKEAAIEIWPPWGGGLARCQREGGDFHTTGSRGGPGRPNHAHQMEAREGQIMQVPEKWYMAMTQLYSSCSFG